MQPFASWRTLPSSIHLNVLPQAVKRWGRGFRMACALSFLLLGFVYSSAASQEFPLTPPERSQRERSSRPDTREPAAAAIPMFSTPFAGRSKGAWTHRESIDFTSGAAVATSAQSEKKRASRKTYVWVGAIVGGIVAVAFAVSNSGTLMSTFTQAPIVLGGALIGALLGAALHPGS